MALAARRMVAGYKYVARRQSNRYTTAQSVVVGQEKKKTFDLSLFSSFLSPLLTLFAWLARFWVFSNFEQTEPLKLTKLSFSRTFVYELLLCRLLQFFGLFFLFFFFGNERSWMKKMGKCRQTRNLTYHLVAEPKFIIYLLCVC